MHLRRMKLAPEAALVAALLILTGAVSNIAHVDPTLAPSTVTAATSTYDGHPVTVTGTVKNITTQRSHDGSPERYDLCDSACLTVIDFTSPTIAEGDRRTIAGKFQPTLPRLNETNILFVGN